jgi:hypothetical protein
MAAMGRSAAATTVVSVAAAAPRRLVLQAKRDVRHVHWAEETRDNEELGKRSSKRAWRVRARVRVRVAPPLPPPARLRARTHRLLRL